MGSVSCQRVGGVGAERVVCGRPPPLGAETGGLETLVPRCAHPNCLQGAGRGALGAGPGNPAPALEAGPSRAGVGWPPAPWPPSNVTAEPRRGLGSPAGQGGLCADAADPCFRAANPFRLTECAGWSQAAWEPGVGLGVRWGAFGQEAPIRDHLLPNRVISPPRGERG